MLILRSKLIPSRYCLVPSIKNLEIYVIYCDFVTRYPSITFTMKLIKDKMMCDYVSI